MKKYFKKNLFDEKSFHKDIQTYGSLFVFCYGFAKLESPTYKGFMQSLTDDCDNYKVYFAPNKALAYSVGLEKELTPEAQRLRPGDYGYTTKEYDTGLHEIGIMLDGDDCSGVLLTNKTEDEVLSKFREYREFDFVNAGSTPMETLAFEKGEVLDLPPVTSAEKLCPKLGKLGMPVEHQNIKLTERFVVCEVNKHVTEEAAEIMMLLGIKMFDFVLLPLGCWSRTTKETKRFHLPLPCRR
ncbi:hypothetical protein MKW94_011882 [Papaver nudicaule]|uniref:Uncharacterized protein n=1 Tax=Papaver nudicaule TaxID=74823 RepID=A0AA41SM56_PAPNU|nr:hypothetical protein [Papaver nudicaule]